MIFKIVTASGVKQDVELSEGELHAISDKLWTLYSKSNDPRLARAHLLLTSLFFGTISKEETIS